MSYWEATFLEVVAYREVIGRTDTSDYIYGAVHYVKCRVEEKVDTVLLTSGHEKISSHVVYSSEPIPLDSIVFIDTSIAQLSTSKGRPVIAVGATPHIQDPTQRFYKTWLTRR